MSQAQLSAEGHRARAEEHQKLGRLLAESGHEWGAVALFYAAYHHVKASLLEDIVFDDWEACQKVNADLLPDDRHTARHHGRKRTSSGREWGINELVFLLYRPVARVYERLHQASIDVRYQSGLRPPVADIVSLFDEFEQLRSEGALSSATLPDG